MAAKKTQRETRLIVSAAVGLHARPAAMLVKLAQGFNAVIEIALDGHKTNAKSIMGILTLGADYGTEVKVSAEGEDAEEAIGAITQIFASNFKEPRIQPVPAAKSGSENAVLILVADDEQSIRGMVERFIGGNGYRTIMACNGLEAVAFFAANPDEIKIAVLDMMMPGMNGAEAAREMRRMRPHLPVIGMSGSMEESPFAGDGTTAFLRKPFGRTEFLSTLRTLLDRETYGSGSRQHESARVGVRS